MCVCVMVVVEQGWVAKQRGGLFLDTHREGIACLSSYPDDGSKGLRNVIIQRSPFIRLIYLLPL